MSEQPTPDHIMQVGLGFWGSKTLLSAVEMGLFSDLAAHPGDLNSIQGRLGLHPRSARDFLDALTAMGFLTRENGVYRNTPSTDLFLDRHKPSYSGGILEMANHRLFGSWNHLTEALRTGLPAERSTRRRRGVFRIPLCGPGASEGISIGDDRHQPRGQYDHRPAVPVEGL